jgi:hypothetical protein
VSCSLRRSVGGQKHRYADALGCGESNPQVQSLRDDSEMTLVRCKIVALGLARTDVAGAPPHALRIRSTALALAVTATHLLLAQLEQRGERDARVRAVEHAREIRARRRIHHLLLRRLAQTHTHTHTATPRLCPS